LYEVKEVNGDICTLKLCESPEVERRAHVGQLIRYRGQDAQDVDEEESGAPASATPTAASREVFEKLREGRFVVFVIKGESPSNLRIAEVLKKEEELVKLWYYVDRTVKNYDNAELTPGLRRVVPEWFDKSTGQVNLRPTSRDLNRGNLVKRTGSFARGEIELVIASFAMHSDGKMPDVQVEKAEKWLRVRSKSDERALRALPGKAARRTHTDMRWGFSDPATDMRWGFHDPTRTSRSRSRGPEEESLWSSAIRLKPRSGD
jgi:hypothetical protein